MTHRRVIVNQSGTLNPVDHPGADPRSGHVRIAVVAGGIYTQRPGPGSRCRRRSGLGGLGHLAVQFAAKMQCDRAVIAGESAQREIALHFGARQIEPVPLDHAQEGHDRMMHNEARVRLVRTSEKSA